MLSFESRKMIAAAFPDGFPDLTSVALDDAVWLYNYGRKAVANYSSEGGNWGLALWRDAEEFLDRLDTANAGGGAQVRLLEAIVDERHAGLARHGEPPRLAPIAVAARRLLAAECSAFLVDANLSSERWEPYTWWAQRRGKQDTIITFNYDLVPEKLADKTNLHVLLPGEELAPGNVAPVLKLHGSVNWKLEKGQITVADELFALHGPGDEIAIATPGPSKRSMASAFQHLWTRARSALAKAEAVVFVGYRFPQTDADARRSLLIDGIGANNSVPHLALHTVLGPNTNSADSLRLATLLKYALRYTGRQAQPFAAHPNPGHKTYTLRMQPAYSQDYIGSNTGGLITQPYWPPMLGVDAG
jgi:hypothetical protein